MSEGPPKRPERKGLPELEPVDTKDPFKLVRRVQHFVIKIDMLDVEFSEQTKKVLNELKFSKLNVPASIQSAAEMLEVHGNYVHDLQILLDDGSFWTILQNLDLYDANLIPTLRRELENYLEVIKNEPLSEVEHETSAASNEAPQETIDTQQVFGEIEFVAERLITYPLQGKSNRAVRALLAAQRALDHVLTHLPLGTEPGPAFVAYINSLEAVVTDAELWDAVAKHADINPSITQAYLEERLNALKAIQIEQFTFTGKKQ